MFINNERKNISRLELIVSLATKTIDITTSGAPDDLLAKPTSLAGLEEHNETVESIILSRLKTKFKL